MKEESVNGREHVTPRPIALVCVSQHDRSGPPAKEPDKLTLIRGKWAWCPTGASDGHDWQPVKAGSLNALRVQLVEVSRLVAVALGAHPAAKTPSKTAKPRASHRKKR